MSLASSIFAAASFVMVARSVPAADLRVFSELARVGIDGEVLASDSGAGTRPREILSPAIARNAFSSFHIYVDAKASEKWTLYVGENPSKALKVTLYREVFVNGLPAKLEPVQQPVEGSGPAVVWMDLWADANATVQRVKIEPELQVDGVADWITYPMEVRVQSAVGRGVMSNGLPPVPVDAPSDTSALRVLSARLCQARPEGTGAAERGAPTPAALIARNAAQDGLFMKDQGDVDWLWLATKASDRRTWCKNPARPAGASAEWYLKIRDRLVTH